MFDGRGTIDFKKSAWFWRRSSRYGLNASVSDNSVTWVANMCPVGPRVLEINSRHVDGPLVCVSSIRMCIAILGIWARSRASCHDLSLVSRSEWHSYLVACACIYACMCVGKTKSLVFFNATLKIARAIILLGKNNKRSPLERPLKWGDGCAIMSAVR